MLEGVRALLCHTISPTGAVSFIEYGHSRWPLDTAQSVVAGMDPQARWKSTAFEARTCSREGGSVGPSFLFLVNDDSFTSSRHKLARTNLTKPHQQGRLAAHW